VFKVEEQELKAKPPIQDHVTALNTICPYRASRRPQTPQTNLTQSPLVKANHLPSDRPLLPFRRDLYASLRSLIVHICHCTSYQRETGSSFALNAIYEPSRVSASLSTGLSGQAAEQELFYVPTPTASSPSGQTTVGSMGSSGRTRVSARFRRSMNGLKGDGGGLWGLFQARALSISRTNMVTT
jgi:hypothetical protein